MKTDYGVCPCSGKYEQRIVEVRLTVKDNAVLLTDVSQGACPLCGSRVYKVDTLAMIEALMKEQPLHTHLNIEER